jgi:hypothetical protein
MSMKDKADFSAASKVRYKHGVDMYFRLKDAAQAYFL